MENLLQLHSQTRPRSDTSTGLLRGDVLELLRRRQQGYSLEQPFYNDPQLFQIDMEEIFQKEWLFAGLSCEIPSRGDYFTLTIGQNSIVVVRDQHNQIRAFHNVCRHRGSTLCQSEKGKVAKLVCPYHQWTFELDGKLLYAGSEIGEGFDFDAHGLKEVALAHAGGYIYLSLADQPSDISGYLEDLQRYLAPHDLENTKIAAENTIIEKANWKLVLENNRECYHCNGSHPELLNSLLEWDDSEDPRAPDEFKERLAKYSELWQKHHIPCGRVSHGLRNRIDRTPLKAGTVSQTIDGQPGCQKLLGKVPLADLGGMRILHLPNSWNHVMGDHAVAFRVLPIGPQETMVTTKWLVHKDAVEGVDYDPAHLRRVWDATNDQDRRLVEQNQRGVNSIAYQPGMYSKNYEFGVINFVQWYCETLESNISS